MHLGFEGKPRIVSREAFVRTYNPRAYADPVALVDDYFRVIDHATRHPEKGSHAIAIELDLPQSQVRGWIRADDPVIPHCVRGLEQAEINGWIAIDVNSETFQGMNILVASCFSGGVIDNRSWAPRFSIENSSALQRIIMSMKWIDAEYELARENSQSSVSEMRVTSSPSILGRVLYVLGAPLGGPSTQSLKLPEYLHSVDYEHKEAFVKTYLKNQGIEFGQNETIELTDQVNGEYLDQLAALVEDVGGEPVMRNGNQLVVPPDAARSLGLG